jgi:hypothetical protein
VEHIEQAAHRHMLKHDNDVGNFGHYSHQQADTWVSQYRSHDDLILNFLKKVIRYFRVKNFLYRDRGTVEEPFMNDTEASLANLFPKQEIVKSYFPNSRHHRESTI